MAGFIVDGLDGHLEIAFYISAGQIDNTDRWIDGLDGHLEIAFYISAGQIDNTDR